MRCCADRDEWFPGAGVGRVLSWPWRVPLVELDQCPFLLAEHWSIRAGGIQ